MGQKSRGTLTEEQQIFPTGHKTHWYTHSMFSVNTIYINIYILISLDLSWPASSFLQLIPARLLWITLLGEYMFSPGHPISLPILTLFFFIWSKSFICSFLLFEVPLGDIISPGFLPTTQLYPHCLVCSPDQFLQRPPHSSGFSLALTLIRLIWCSAQALQLIWRT